MRQHIPNALTLGNLTTGCAGIVALMTNTGVPVAHFVWIACLFDFADGFAARALKSTSAVGKELDGLADMVSFGILPALLMYDLLRNATGGAPESYLAFSIALCAAWRLAVFNTDESQRASFRGLPTPANALFLTSLPFLPFYWVNTTPVLITVVIVFSTLMVLPIRLFALKFGSVSWRDNLLRYVFIGFSLVSLVAAGSMALPFVILAYIALSLAFQRFIK